MVVGVTLQPSQEFPQVAGMQGSLSSGRRIQTKEQIFGHNPSRTTPLGGHPSGRLSGVDRVGKVTSQNSFQEAGRTVHPARLIRGDENIQTHHTRHKGQEEKRHADA